MTSQLRRAAEQVTSAQFVFQAEADDSSAISGSRVVAACFPAFPATGRRRTLPYGQRIHHILVENYANTRTTTIVPVNTSNFPPTTVSSCFSSSVRACRYIVQESVFIPTLLESNYRWYPFLLRRLQMLPLLLLLLLMLMLLPPSDFNSSILNKPQT